MINKADLQKKTKIINESTSTIKRMIEDGEEDNIEQKLGVTVSKKEAPRKHNQDEKNKDEVYEKQLQAKELANKWKYERQEVDLIR